MSVEAGIGIGAAVLLGLYILIISEIVDRTFASLIVSTLSVAALALFNERPDLEEILTWVDMDTLMLLFGMMILVAITSETGFFDYMAVFVFKKTKGRTWPLICSLSIVSMVSALVLDSVSTVLLMTPVIIRICEVTNLNPVQVLTIMILAVNIGSTASPVGNPPNVMIINHAFIKESGIGFLDFVLHIMPGVLILTVQSFMHIRYFTFRQIATLQNAEPVEVSTIKHELKMWQNTERSISAISKFDDISRSVIRSRVLLLNEALERELQNSHDGTEMRNVSYYLSGHARVRTLESGVFDPKDNNENMDEDVAHEQLTRRLEELYPIKNKELLIQCGIAFFVVICFFFLHAVPYFENLSLGWASLLGVCLLLIISNNNDDFKTSLLMVEWSSLLFFATLYVLMESLTKIGLIEYVGSQMSKLVEMASTDNRHTAAVLLVLWVSTIISAFLDNIPLTSMMTKVIATLSTSLNLPPGPMVWALAFGCGIGGNGTLIASSSNLVCIGVA
ncbi:hypothetical protein HA402_009465 [Bradysia odoriphaga]|nr:hypothetical protein HA402_009465 [Bradysia odoriphaga]